MYKHIGTRPELLIGEYPKAYEALPEPYKADGCLYFYVSEGGTLYADYDLGGVFYWDGAEWGEMRGDTEPPDSLPTDIQSLLPESH